MRLPFVCRYMRHTRGTLQTHKKRHGRASCGDTKKAFSVHSTCPNTYSVIHMLSCQARPPFTNPSIHWHPLHAKKKTKNRKLPRQKLLLHSTTQCRRLHHSDPSPGTTRCSLRRFHISSNSRVAGRLNPWYNDTAHIWLNLSRIPDINTAEPEIK